MPPRKGSGKKARPSFGSAKGKDAEPETPASWVYRSEPQAAAPAPEAARSRTPAKVEPKPAKPLATAVADATEAGRLERVADWLTMPTAIALTLVLAPIGWLLGSRRQ